MMTALQALVPSLLFLVATFPWCSHGFPDQENLQALDAEKRERQVVKCSSGVMESNRAKFIGVGYNLLLGNPEGGTEKGSLDPGFRTNWRILKLTCNDRSENPDQIAYSSRSSEETKHGVKIVGGTKSYQEKFCNDVKVEGTIFMCYLNVVEVYIVYSLNSARGKSGLNLSVKFDLADEKQKYLYRGSKISIESSERRNYSKWLRSL